MTTTDHPRPLTTQDLDYRCEFNANEIDAIDACVTDHGFAVVKQMITPDIVARMRKAVLDVCDPFNTLPQGETRYRHAFCDAAPVMLQLFDNQPWLKIQQKLLKSDQLTIHRCAAILKQIGAPPVNWHTDWHGYHQGEPTSTGEILNIGDVPSGAWFYLEGTHPSRAGLAIIPDSHTIDWTPPQGFDFTEKRRSFHPKGQPPTFYDKLDVPGALPLITDPGDMILFAARTYHYASAHQGNQVRCSCAMGMRPSSMPINAPWELPESTRCLKQYAPQRYQPFLEKYTGYVEWRKKTS